MAFRFENLTVVEEVVSALYISLDQGYVMKGEFDKIYSDANYLVAKLNALIRSLK